MVDICDVIVAVIIAVHVNNLGVVDANDGFLLVDVEMYLRSHVDNRLWR